MASWLDRFRTPKTPPTQPRGASGRAHTQGFLELEELNTDLQGFNGLRIYDKMYRTDPDAGRSVSMACNPVVLGTWELEPYGGKNATAEDERVAAACEWALFEYLNGGLGLDYHFAEALPVVTRSGFAPFEQLWS